MIIRSVNKIAEIAYYKGLRYVVISPGSRSAPLTLAFARHPGIETIIIGDERSAGYIALGMALSLKKTVGLVCTSGTATINLYPAVTEAYYLSVPLLVLTADRPSEWIDQSDGQTIHQEGLFINHIKGSYTYPTHETHPDSQWHQERLLSEAINLTGDFPSGPVHINIPVREPFYPEKKEKFSYTGAPKIIEKIEPEFTLPESGWHQLKKQWSQADRILIMGGQNRLNPKLNEILNAFCRKFNTPVLSDILSNLAIKPDCQISFQDSFLLTKDGKMLAALKPDLMITFGKSVLSKNLKSFLRKYKPDIHWHIQPGGRIADTFQSLTAHLAIDETTFFREASRQFLPHESTAEYRSIWKDQDRRASKVIKNFFPAEDFSELEAAWIVRNHLPGNSMLHLANSMPVRLMNYFGKPDPAIEIFSNRGTSGIDGCNSVAVGAAIQSEQLNILLTGDMAFFYDRNAFWHSHIPVNLRIIILNNHGGGIFRMIDGSSGLAELEKYFETEQPLTAENTAKDFGFEYHICRTAHEVNKYLPAFFPDGEKAKILEIETSGRKNKEILERLKSEFK